MKVQLPCRNYGTVMASFHSASKYTGKKHPMTAVLNLRVGNINLRSLKYLLNNTNYFILPGFLHDYKDRSQTQLGV